MVQALPSVCAFRLVAEVEALLCHLPGEKGQRSHTCSHREARPGSRAFFYPSGQNLVKWLLPAKEAEKAPRSTANPLFRWKGDYDSNERLAVCFTLWEGVSGVCSSYQESWKGCPSPESESKKTPGNQDTHSHLIVRGTHCSDAGRPGRTQVLEGIWVI